MLELESSLFSMRSSFEFDQFKINTPQYSIDASFGNHPKMIDISQNVLIRTLSNAANVQTKFEYLKIFDVGDQPRRQGLVLLRGHMAPPLLL